MLITLPPPFLTLALSLSIPLSLSFCTGLVEIESNAFVKLKQKV